MNIFKKKKIQGVLLVLVVLGGLAFTVPTNRYFELTKNLEIFTNKVIECYNLDEVVFYAFFAVNEKFIISVF